jgi:hypothetical protein
LEPLSGKRKNGAPRQSISKKNREKKVRKQEVGGDVNKANFGSGMAGVGDVNKANFGSGMTAMNLMSWKCRGLGNPQAVRELYRLVKEKHPKLVFLIETRLQANKMTQIKCKLGSKNVFVVDCVGKSGGLALLWSEDVEVEIKNYSRQHINANVKTATRQPT